MARTTSLTKRCLAAPGRIARLCMGRRDLSVKAQLATGAVIFALSAWVTATSVGYLGNRHLLSDSYQQISRLEQAYADLQSRSELSTTALLEQVGRLEATAEDQRASIRDLAAIQDTLGRQLQLAQSPAREHRRAAQLRPGAGRRDRAGDGRGRGSDAERGGGQVRARGAAGGDQERLPRSAGARRRRRLEVGLHWQLAHLEDEMARLRSPRERPALAQGLGARQRRSARGAGRRDRGRRRGADRARRGRAGPVRAARSRSRPRIGSARPARRRPTIRSAATSNAFGCCSGSRPPCRWRRRSISFTLTAHYGKRRDPFTRTLGVPQRPRSRRAAQSEVLATAPGQVIAAGPSGPYGNMVELDHGMGIVTRYAHLKSVASTVGERSSSARTSA